jgi:hypothetical protein
VESLPAGSKNPEIVLGQRCCAGRNRYTLWSAATGRASMALPAMTSPKREPIDRHDSN